MYWLIGSPVQAKAAALEIATARGPSPSALAATRDLCPICPAEIECWEASYLMEEVLYGSKRPLAFSETQLKARLSNVSVISLAAFSLSCAARLLPGYYKWHDDLSQEPPKEVYKIFKDILDQTKEGLVVSDSSRLLELAEHLLDYVPDDDAPWSRMRPLAEDAIASLSYAIRCLATADPQEAAWAARRAYEAADQLAIFDLAGDDKGLPAEEALIFHPIVQTELERQDRDIGLVLRGGTSEVLKITTSESILIL
jgi:hypothetical protein